MSYNKQYNTRHSGRYNTPGQFVPAGEIGNPPLPPAPQSPFQNAMQRKQPPLPSQPPNSNLQTIQTMDVDMKPSIESGAGQNNAAERPPWMKPKLQGVKKLSNKERRRRQNENLRRLLTPKNALMVLNEMLPNEQLTNQFKVEPAATFNQYYNNKPMHNFCADLIIKGKAYKGYGENKLIARNVAAEQAIRDLIIQKMNKVLGADATAGPGEGEDGEDEALPMIQLASFALHKLFTEWEYEGHKVPQLKPTSNSVSEAGSEAGGAGAGGAGSTGGPRPRGTPNPAPKKKELPANAASMHPCMLLTYMRPNLEYRELAVDGDKPQNMTFTLGVDVDGSTYIGKASNKKEARRQAAKAACASLWGVRFIENANETPKSAQ